MSRELLNQQQTDASLKALNQHSRGEWTYNTDRLRRKFVFGNFIEAMGFMMSAALAAEKMDHHPEWKNVYKIVEVELTTHSSGGVTQLDVDLAEQMQTLAHRLGA